MKQQKIFSGKESYLSIKKILQSNNIKKYMLVCDNLRHFHFLENYLDEISIDRIQFDKFTPNPRYEDIVSGVELFNKENCDFIIAVGGGSAIDVAKCINIYHNMNPNRLFFEQEYTSTEVKMIAIPTTAGTGSESTKFAAIYYKNEKQSITTENMVPEYIILEPELLKTLPLYIKKASMLDALCQGIESMWSVKSTDVSKNLSRLSAKMILANMESYLLGDETVYEDMLIAANLAGQAINISETTAAHAMSYKITSLYKIAHGHAVAICMPYVFRYLIENTDRCIDARGEEYLKDVISELTNLLGATSALEAVNKLDKIIRSMDMVSPLLKNDNEIKILSNSVNPDRLKNFPVSLDYKTIEMIYKNIFKLKQDGENEKN